LNELEDGGLKGGLYIRVLGEEVWDSNVVECMKKKNNLLAFYGIIWYPFLDGKYIDLTD